MNIDFDRTTRAYGWACSKLGSWAEIPSRLIVGYGFLEHGYAKILKGPEHFVAILHAVGVANAGGNCSKSAINSQTRARDSRCGRSPLAQRGSE